MRPQRQPRRGRALARGDLEHVARALGVVADHVEDERTDDGDVRDIARSPILRGEHEVPLHQALRQRACTHAIRRVLLAGEVDEPDIALEAARACERKQLLGGEEQRRGRRVVVVGAGGRRAQEIAAALLVVDVLHVRRVVVVAHHHGLRAIAPGITSTMLRSAGASWFFAQPSIHGNAKSVSQRNT